METLMEKVASDVKEDNVDPDIVLKEEEFTDTISDSEGSEEVDAVESPKEEKKKDKKEKKEKKEKVARALGNYVFFKGHPDNKDAINTAAEVINEETDKPFGKVKAAGIVWGKLTDEEKEEWKQRSIADFEAKQTAENTD